MTKWIIGALLALIGLAVGAGLVGLLLPRDHVARSSLTLRQPVDSVWGVLRDPAGLVGHWSGLDASRRVEDSAGREVWVQRVGGEDMRLVMSDVEPMTGFVSTVDAQAGAPFGGRWVYRLEPTPDSGSRLTVVEEGWIANPFFRVVARAMGLHTTMDGYLHGVAARFSEGAVPVHEQ